MFVLFVLSVSNVRLISTAPFVTPASSLVFQRFIYHGGVVRNNVSELGDYVTAEGTLLIHSVSFDTARDVER